MSLRYLDSTLSYSVPQVIEVVAPDYSGQFSEAVNSGNYDTAKVALKGLSRHHLRVVKLYQ